MGSHTCLFYESEKNLLDLVASYFEQGFRVNESCLWVVPQSLGIDGARVALSKKIKDLNIYIEKNQFKLLDYKDIYLTSGVFNPDATLKLFAEEEQDVLRQGFSGLRVSGDASWLQEKDWDVMNAYEKSAAKLLPQSKITALCTYPSKKFDTSKLFSLSFSHDAVIVKKEGKTDILIDKRHVLNSGE